MNTPGILIERRIATAPFWMPFEQQWADIDVDVVVRSVLTPAELRSHGGVAIVDSLLATTILESSRILSSHAVVADRISALTMVTSERPDGIDGAIAGVEGVSLTGRAIAEIVIPEFYGIQIDTWTTEPVSVDSGTILVTEDEKALLPTAVESDFHEDLGRAWFLMTDTPFVSHVCTVPESLAATDPGIIHSSARALTVLREAAGNERRRLRRNISGDHGIDRDLVVDLFDGLRFQLDASSQRGLAALYSRVGVEERHGPTANRILTLND